jgi:hypothetical protein
VKEIWRSKTILVQLLTVITVSTMPAVEQYIKLHPAIAIAIFAISNIFLRILTKEPIKRPGIGSSLSMIALLLLLASCTTVDQKLKTDEFYKRDMIIEFEGVKSEGFVVLPKRNSYKLRFHAKGKLDLFTLTTCHREITAEKIRGGIFNQVGTEYEMQFTPIEGIETSNCPIFIGGYDEQRGRHSWGAIEIADPSMDLEAQTLCNGEKRNHKGISICQSKEGLIQEISFPEPVRTAFEGSCKMDSPDGKTFLYEMIKGECAFVFMAKDGRMHRLTTLGYEKIIVRGQ